MQISIIILTFNRRDSVLNLLSGLISLQDSNMEIIVVDNGSADNTVNSIHDAYPSVKLICLSENVGIGARNRGLEIAQGEIAISLDDDMIDLNKESLAHLRLRFSEDPNLAGLCFKVTWPGTAKIRDWVHRRPPEYCDATFATYEITEGAVAWRLSAIKEVGLYRDDFFISHEGIELALRVLNANWIIVYDGSVIVGHAHAQGGRAGWRRYYYDTRNMFWVAVLHFPFWYSCKYLFVGLTAMFIYSIRDLHLLAWLKAVKDGIGGLGQLYKERKLWSERTAAYVKEVDSWRPDFWTMVKKRLWQKKFSME